MLTRLFIKNYALIEHLDIRFDEGLNIITGETGAGKSIIMGALGLILGNRVDGKHFFDDTKKCVIEGFFNVAPYNLADFFKENDLEYDKDTIIRREIAVDGKSRAFVNDSPVTLNVLKLLGEQLFDIHSQHATLQLNTEKFQLMVIDSVAKNDRLLSTFRDSFLRYKKSRSALEQLKEQIAQANVEMDFNQFQFNELFESRLQIDEQELLETEISQLENAEEIKRALFGANMLLEDEERSVTVLLKEALNHLHLIHQYLPTIGPLAERLNSAFIELRDISAEVSHIERAVTTDESRLQFVTERLNLIYGLQKKHRVDTISELLTIQEQLDQKLQSVANQEEHLASLEKQLDYSYDELISNGEALHDARVAVLSYICNHVQSMLAQVGMLNAQLEINLTPLSIEKFKNNGCDDVEFLFSANKGQPLQPIHRVASGGELSRVMLAVKSLVAQSSSLPSIIFDEIDSGISGEVALKVGDIMENLAENMQVMAITHLPQIASKGKSHFKVSKQDEGEKTRTNILLLNENERVMEVAQMLSGANPGESALKHAMDLIRN
ncbi:DNA repair protein RecN [Sphingobacterium shayense]|uniref:DNA repair protein RecN n=1 Tax=Sphingobacterium shayense TaxID=626343 RepID=UPI0015560EE0|nr:DNA repair protein RecN [Sphingobacterium shayense]NQD71473.1 DNA repair protein RecN [Sphingobacterium shayense]